ncbi:MAG: hypothetical protein B7Y80_06610 [Hyphomicrobium sp. 32-62-53]|nr:MAG: hypothetical protein B7Z29_04910 [Hyphomicrobium sp. 12-62-95]OYY00297.1 MAG: hypothetical protein B7Y80_06610 [Hyphomicrobium sp. 32-62-53]
MIRTHHDADRLDGGARSSALTQLFWAGAGFVAGVVFWHLIGFWSIVSVAVLGTGPQVSVPTTVVTGRRHPPPVETGSLPARASPCTALTLNRRTGETRSAMCPAATFHHINGGLGTKDDLALVVSDWTTQLR